MLFASLQTDDNACIANYRILSVGFTKVSSNFIDVCLYNDCNFNLVDVAMLDVSVVIPTRDRQMLLRRALNSVVLQTLAPKEIIVVDDGSIDNTREMVRTEFPDIVYRFQSPSGISKARNSGLESSRADWIAFLDSDDEWKSNKLEKQVAWLLDNPAFRICHCDEIWIRNGIRVNPKKRHRKRGGWIYPYCLPLCVVSPSSVIVHASVFEGIGKFDVALPVCEDYDMWLRMALRYQFGYIEEKLVVKYGGHSDQLSKAFPAMDQYRIMALKKVLDGESLNMKNRILTLEMIVRKLRIYINGARKRKSVCQEDEFEKLLKQYSFELDQLITNAYS